MIYPLLTNIAWIVIAATGLRTIPTANQIDMQKFFHALSAVESNHNDNAIGDNGRALGRYQIWQVYWQDSRISGKYEQVKNKKYAERVMIGYWKRYCPTALKNKDLETLARIHNGGPKGNKKQATIKYWLKVKKYLN